MAALATKGAVEGRQIVTIRLRTVRRAVIARNYDLAVLATQLARHYYMAENKDRKPMPMPDLLPTVKLGDHDITRLIIGGNPFSGGSHASPEMDQAFVDYYTTENIKAALRECEAQGLNTMQCRADRHIMRMLHEYRNEGGTLQWIAQTASELRDLPGNIRAIADAGAIAIYHHGTRTDALWREGNIGEMRALLQIMRDCGVAVGVGTHRPEVIEYVEEHGWDVDFYMACFHGLGIERPKDGTLGQFLPGEVYDDADRDRMTTTIRACPKTCLGFKILAASRKCGSPETVREAFRYAFDNIKPRDAVVVGMFQRDCNQVAMNAGFVRDLLGATPGRTCRPAEGH